MNEEEFHDITKQYVDCPYIRTSKTGQGFDCVRMMYDFYTRMGADLPKEWKGWTLENYSERWERGEGRKEFMEFMMGLGKSVNKKFMQKGDLIIYDGTEPAPAIYLGSGKAVSIFVEGGRVFPVRLFDKHIKDVRRLI